MRDEKAFPYTAGQWNSLDERGMTLRDYFAGQALIGLVHSFPDKTMKFIAETAYTFADIMLEERKKIESL